VKEGGYPPPPRLPQGTRSQRTLESVSRFFRESFSHSFYWKYYLYTLCFIVGFLPFRDFLVFYAQQELKMDLDAYGKVMAKCDLVQMGVFFLLGLCVDRLHPLRAGLIGFFLVFAAGLCSFLFIHSIGSFKIWVMISFGAVAVYQGATGAIGPLLLPRTHYGQFNAASALVFHFGSMTMTPVIGGLTDKYGNAAVFPWFFSFSALGILFLWIVYRDWKRMGGDESFTPPGFPGELPVST
jgi:predicted MFS family arabinose efflux permease